MVSEGSLGTGGREEDVWISVCAIDHAKFYFTQFTLPAHLAAFWVASERRKQQRSTAGREPASSSFRLWCRSGEALDFRMVLWQGFTHLDTSWLMCTMWWEHLCLPEAEFSSCDHFQIQWWFKCVQGDFINRTLCTSGANKDRRWKSIVMKIRNLLPMEGWIVGWIDSFSLAPYDCPVKPVVLYKQ